MAIVEPTIRRIVVAVDASGHGRAAIEAAAQMAARARAELIGLYVEDVALLRLAEYPFAREFSVRSATGRSLSPPAMAQALRTEARRARDSLAETAARYGVAWTFGVRRGDVASELIAAVESADLLVLGRMQAASTRSLRVGSTVQSVVGRCTKTLLVVPGDGHATGPVVALFGDAASGPAVVAMAGALARTGARAIVVLVTDDALRTDAESALAAAGLDGAVRTVALGELSAALGGLAPAGRPTLVVHRTARRDLVLEAVDCPIVIVA